MPDAAAALVARVAARAGLVARRRRQPAQDGQVGQRHRRAAGGQDVEDAVADARRSDDGHALRRPLDRQRAGQRPAHVQVAVAVAVVIAAARVERQGDGDHPRREDDRVVAIRADADAAVEVAVVVRSVDRAPQRAAGWPNPEKVILGGDGDGGGPGRRCAERQTNGDQTAGASQLGYLPK
jgi:hypothetical protein